MKEFELVTKFGSSYLEDAEVIELAVSRYVSLLNQASNSVDIFSGEAHLAVYSSHRVLAAFRAAKVRGVTIRMIVGPVISAYRDAHGEKRSGLVDLVREGVVSLFVRGTRERRSHYRIFDSNKVDLEEPHEPLTPLSRRTVSEMPCTAAILAEFESYIQKGRAWPVRNVQTDIVLLTEHEIRGISRMSRGTFDDLSTDEIRHLHKTFLFRQEKAEDRLQKQFARTILPWKGETSN